METDLSVSVNSNEVNKVNIWSDPLLKNRASVSYRACHWLCRGSCGDLDCRSRLFLHLKPAAFILFFFLSENWSHMYCVVCLLTPAFLCNVSFFIGKIIFKNIKCMDSKKRQSHEIRIYTIRPEVHHPHRVPDCWLLTLRAHFSHTVYTSRHSRRANKRLFELFALFWSAYRIWRVRWWKWNSEMIQHHAVRYTFNTTHHLGGSDRIPEAQRASNAPPSAHTVTVQRDAIFSFTSCSSAEVVDLSCS